MCYGAALKEVCKVGGFEQRAALPSRRENSTTRDGLIGSNWFGLGPFGRGRIGSTRVGSIWIGTDPDGSEQIETDRVGSALGSVLSIGASSGISSDIFENLRVSSNIFEYLQSIMFAMMHVCLFVSDKDVSKWGAAVATAAGVAASGRNNESKYGQWKTTGHKRDEKSGHCELQRMHGWKSTADI
ncbi:hypothetical protein HZH66_010141 [Vespula vulgaris]|uniref:Uncharacterized protein n=1 Tax=Vespula vulgaris TaxID=7454 RepID=A0A834JIQ4_VESVU|nr:hypothetical protein HZH66_010141 [Vespula vulgaris]